MLLDFSYKSLVFPFRLVNNAKVDKDVTGLLMPLFISETSGLQSEVRMCFIWDVFKWRKCNICMFKCASFLVHYLIVRSDKAHHGSVYQSSLT